MFNITSVYLNNFRSYNGEHHFEMPTEDGLYFLTGENKREPKLGSNGAGKSTLLDAIYWCLYGHTLRGLKASDVVTWGQTSSAVIVNLIVNDKNITVTRQQSPNDLNIVIDDGPTLVVDQAALDNHIRLNAESFVYAVILPQFGQSFFELKPAEKLILFSQILNLDFWLEKSKQATDATTAIEKTITKTTADIQNASEWIASTTVEIEEFESMEKVFEIERAAAIKQIDAKADKLDEELDELNTKKNKLTKAVQFWEVDKERRVQELKQLEAVWNKNTERREALSTQHAVLKAELTRMRRGLESLNEVGAECPTCLQIVDQQHLRREQRKQINAINDKKAELNEISKRLDDVHRFVVKSANDIAAFTEGTNDVKREYEANREKLAVIGERFSAISQQASTLKQAVTAKEKETNPYVGIVDERRAKLQSLKQKLEQYEAKLEALNADHTATGYWVSGFKRIRLFIIEETLRLLEIEVNNNLASLGLVDWSIEFDVERENKSGGVTKGFVVFIKCPSHPEPVRWESWSGGETQRLQLAGDFGLASLIMQQAGLVNAVEFYDEPSDHLSDEGLIDLAETLQQRAVNDHKRILLVDHRMPEFGDFRGVFTVVKDKKGSHIRREPRQ